MVSFSDESYGEAECISYTRYQDKSIAVMKDEQYGFTYTVTSEMDDVLDGLIQQETKTSDFFEKYIEYISNTKEFQDVIDKYNAKIECTRWNDIKIYTLNGKKTETTASLMAEVINDLDTRKYFTNNDCMFIIMGSDEFHQEKYSIDDLVCRSPDDITINWMLLSAALSINDSDKCQGDTPDIDQLEYMYSEYINIADMPGRKLKNRPIRDPNMDTGQSRDHTLVLHFMYNNQEWIVADCPGESSDVYVYCISSNEKVCTQKLK